MPDVTDTQEIPAAVDTRTDSEILRELHAKVIQLESVFGQLIAAAQGNPMLKQLLGIR